MDRHLKSTSAPLAEPLSFKEYFNTSDSSDKEEAFKRYLCFGSLPKVIELQKEDEILEYLEGKYGITLLEGVALVRPRINMEVYLKLLDYIVRNVGTLTTPGNLVSVLEQQGISIAKNTIVEYLELTYESDLLYCIGRTDLKTDTSLIRGEKYYLKDFGLRYFMTKQNAQDKPCDALIENAIYLELRRRYENVFMGKIGKYTIDFVCHRKNATGNGCTPKHYYQVVRDPYSEETKEFKVDPLLTPRDNYPKTLLSLDKTTGDCIAGVKCEYVVDWLLE